MPNILALACSPTKGGNSDTLLDAFIEGMKKQEDMHIEKVYIHDIPAEPYSFSCSIPDAEKESEFCALVEKVKKCEGLIIATPTYNFGVPSPLKNFIDRIGFISLDYKNLNWMKQPSGKLGYLRTFFIVTGGTPNHMERLLFPFFPERSFVFSFFIMVSGGGMPSLVENLPLAIRPKTTQNFSKNTERMVRNTDKSLSVKLNSKI